MHASVVDLDYLAQIVLCSARLVVVFRVVFLPLFLHGCSVHFKLELEVLGTGILDKWKVQSDHILTFLHVRSFPFQLGWFDSRFTRGPCWWEAGRTDVYVNVFVVTLGSVSLETGSLTLGLYRSYRAAE